MKSFGFRVGGIRKMCRCFIGRGSLQEETIEKDLAWELQRAYACCINSKYCVGVEASTRRKLIREYCT
jgi:hypothetical protein